MKFRCMVSGTPDRSRIAVAGPISQSPRVVMMIREPFSTRAANRRVSATCAIRCRYDSGSSMARTLPGSTMRRRNRTVSKRLGTIDRATANDRSCSNHVVDWQRRGNRGCTIDRCEFLRKSAARVLLSRVVGSLTAESLQPEGPSAIDRIHGAVDFTMGNSSADPAQ